MRGRRPITLRCRSRIPACAALVAVLLVTIGLDVCASSGSVAPDQQTLTTGPGTTTAGPGTTTAGPGTTTAGPGTTTAGGTTTTTPLEETDPEVAIAACEARVRQAHVVFETTRRMQVGRVDRLTAKASIAGGPPEIEGATDTTIRELDVRCFLQAQLRGPKFAIEPKDFRKRSFLDQSTVFWTWDVEPKETGKLTLTLEVQSLVRDQPSALDELISDILVEAKDRTLLEKVNDGAIAVVTHPVVQFFGAGVVLGGFAVIWRKVTRKRTAS